MADEAKKDPFEKVFLVARIANLEMTLDHQQEVLKQKDQAIAGMAAQLRSSAQGMNRALGVSEASVLAAFAQVGAWLSPDDRARWDELFKRPELVHGLTIAVKALILEVLNGGGEGPKPEAGPDGG